MNTFYSVIFASVNSIISERLAIGLVMVDNNGVWFRYSTKKLSLMKHFFSEEAFLLLKTSLKNIGSTVSSVNVDQTTVVTELFTFTSKNQYAFSVGYLKYLSRYSNSTLTFNEPVKIDVEASDELFSYLYNEFIFVEIEEAVKVTTVETVKAQLYPSIKKHVNLDRRIETGTIPGLIIPVELDFIGKNQRPVVGKVTNFDTSNSYLDGTLAKFILLVNTLEANNQSGCNFIIADEPDKMNIHRHKTWNEIRNLRNIDLVPFQETQRVTDYMEIHDVRPYFEAETA